MAEQGFKPKTLSVLMYHGVSQRACSLQCCIRAPRCTQPHVEQCQPLEDHEVQELYKTINQNGNIK